MTNLLSRVYNSTLGVPQQFLFRFLRALKDEDIDMFSREGILAPELLPVVGLLADHKTDPRFQDAFTDMGTFGNFIGEILTDPATFLTAGATGLAKTGKAVNKFRVGGLASKKAKKEFAASGLDISAHKTAGELREALHAGIQEGKFTTGAAKNAALELGKVGGNTLMKDIMGQTGKESLLIAIPGLARWGASMKAPAAIQKHKSWFALQNHLVYGKTTEKTKPFFAWMGKGIRDMGDMGESAMDGLATMAGAVTAFKTGFKSLDSTFFRESPEFGNDQMAAARFRTAYGSAARKLEKVDIQELIKRVRLKLENGATMEEVVKTRGIPRELRDEIRGWPKSKNKPVATENIAEPLGEFLDSIRSKGRFANKVLKKAETDFIRRAKPDGISTHWASDTAYDAGQWLRKKKQLMFNRGEKVTTEWIKDLTDGYLEREAKGRLILEQQQKRLIATAEKIAKAEDMEPEEVSRLLNIITEGTLHPLDLAANREAMLKGGAQKHAAVVNYADILGRVRGNIEALRRVTDLDKNSQKWLEALDSTTLEILNSKGLHWSRRELITIKPGQLATDAFDGKALHQLSEAELQSIKAQDVNLDPDLRRTVRDLIRDRKATPIDSAADSPVLSRFNAEEVIQSRRIEDLDRAKLKEALKNPDIDDNTKRAIRDTLRRGTPKTADRGKEVPYPLGSNLDPEMQTLVNYLLALADLQQGRFTSLTLERLERAHQQLGRIIPEQAKAVFKNADQKDLDFVFGLSDDATRLAHQANGFSNGAPLGYLPRLRSRSKEAKLRNLLGQVDNISGLKGVESSLKARHATGRSLTLEEIGVKLDEIAKDSTKGKEVADEVRTLLEKEGLPLGTYHEDHLDMMLARMGRDFEMNNSADLINSVFGHAKAAEEGLLGGKIVEVLDDQSRIIEHSGKVTKFKASKKGSKLTTGADESVTAARWLVVEQADGKRALIDLHQSAREGLSVELLGDQADSLGHAFVAHQLGGAAKLPLHEARPGQWVSMGSDDVVHMFRSQVAPDPGKFAELLAGVDWVNFGLKTFQTVLRPAHHIGNLISGLAQTRAAGASIGSSALAHRDIARIMFGLGDGAKIKRDFLRATGFEGEFTASRRTAEMVLGLVSGKKLDDLEDLGGIKVHGQELTHQEIFEGAVESGLLTGTFAKEDIKLGGRLSADSVEARGRMERLRYKDDKTFSEGASAAWQEIMGATQVPEISARMATVYALVYDGHNIKDAYELAKRAHVDYSKLGLGERQVLKRLIPYYTFGRSYIPFALERMAKDPGIINKWVAGIEQSGAMGVDANGKVVFEKGKFQADLGRLNANTDALMSVMGMAEHLLPGSIATVKGVQSVESPAFMALGGGGVPGVVLGSIGETGFEVDSAAKALMDATFVGRLFSKVGQSVEERDLNPLNDFATSMFLPARINNEPELARQFQTNMAKRALRRLELMAQEAKHPGQLDELRREANDIREALLSTQQDFGN